MTDLSFTTEVRGRDPIKFTLDEEKFTFHPPKLARPMVEIIVNGVSDTQAFIEWLQEGLDKDSWERIKARMLDPDDELDLPDVSKIATALVEHVAGRPTMSPSDSPPPPPRTGPSSTAKPRRKG